MQSVFMRQHQTKNKRCDGLRRSAANMLVLFQSYFSQLMHGEFSTESVQKFCYEETMNFYLENSMIVCCDYEADAQLTITKVKTCTSICVAHMYKTV